MKLGRHNIGFSCIVYTLYYILYNITYYILYTIYSLLGDDSAPLNYSAQEYEDFSALDIEEFELDEDSDSNNSDDEDEEDQEDSEDFANHLTMQLISKFKGENNREPNDSELINIQKQVQGLIEELADGENDDDDSEEEEDDA